ncbi:glucose 1-dehydrogenase [Salirhabdus salicampi]|uniref:glucose 1-dehydrogenase n=1 Tax=Salirhabdus salicampi TaxID=476102 RepID=UPI0020C23062|nr:glucose 1-dehydrogenase [Salirhabdus salicampi]MCP8615945.1 glucose 1-dehydrogenase [Salirhabdus salicampi]
MGRLENKVSLITGGASGIGKEMAKLFAQEGSKVAVTDINVQAGEEVVAEIKESGGEAIFIKQDVTVEDEWKSTIQEVQDTYGSLHVLANNAGIGVLTNIEEETLEHWRKVQQINVESVFLGTKHAVLAMKNNKEKSSIINFSSILGLVGEGAAPTYNASKGAVKLLTKSVALHCASQGYNIRVNSIHPGYIDTPMVAGAIEDPAPIAALHPVGRLGEAKEIAYGALFLASDESTFATGSELVIDGGYTAQ